jgi:predicted AAA+ superfamily ATPase
MIDRSISKKLLKYLATFPVVFLTGPRQSGKSTLLKNLLIEYNYVNLEHPNVLNRAKEDPEGFLDQLGDKAVIDEAQNFPELFSYIQIRVDDDNKPGQFVLSESQNFLIMDSISQSLAGRVGVLTLLPLSNSELIKSDLSAQSPENWMLNGGYPRIFDQNISPNDFYESYIKTYIERDVRSIKNITNLSEFHKFLIICAGRVGQQIEYSDMADIVGVSVATIKSWFSILEASYVAFLMPPFYNNLNKRLRKSPKLYFYDTGIVANLLGITQENQLITHPIYGYLFENAIVLEYLKVTFNLNVKNQQYFFRESNNNEIDLILDFANHVELIEIKSAKTGKPAFSDTIHKYANSFEKPATETVVYGGDEKFKFKDAQFLPWNTNLEGDQYEQ